MKTAFRDSFAKDLKAVKDKALLKRIKHIIESIEDADSLSSLLSIKKLKGHDQFYRLRVGDYRLGFAVIDDIVVFVRFLNRKDIYKYFP